MKLDLILENIRMQYSLGLLEESESMSEKELLKGKILINESVMNIRSMLVEEGTIQAVQNVLEEAWTDAVMQAANAATGEDAGDAVDAPVDASVAAPVAAPSYADQAQGYVNQASDAVQGYANQAGDAANQVIAAGQGYANQAGDAVQGYANQASAAAAPAIAAGQQMGQQAIDTAAADKGYITRQQALTGAGLAGAGLLAGKLHQRFKR